MVIISDSFRISINIRTLGAGKKLRNIKMKGQNISAVSVVLFTLNVLSKV